MSSTDQNLDLYAYLCRCIRVHRKAISLDQVEASQLAEMAYDDYVDIESGGNWSLEQLITVALRLGLDTQIICTPRSVAKCPTGQNAPTETGQNATR